jgi:ubiquinone/menaquinone biosynthesis C-methylase UbiE
MARSKALELCHGKKGALLEIGCGEGLFLARVGAQEPGLALSGIDNNEQRVRQAAQRLGPACAVTRGDAARLVFPDGSFDTVVCVNVLFNLDSPETVRSVLSEMARVCRRDGTVIIDFRNGRNPLLRLKYACAPWYDPTVKGLPLRTYTFAAMERLLAGCGLRVRSRHPLGFFVKALAPLIVLEAGR